jgi:hypothetical protein
MRGKVIGWGGRDRRGRAEIRRERAQERTVDQTCAKKKGTQKDLIKREEDIQENVFKIISNIHNNNQSKSLGIHMQSNKYSFFLH